MEGNDKGLSLTTGESVPVKFSTYTAAAPSNVTAQAGRDRMIVTWTPGLGESHRVRYRVKDEMDWTTVDDVSTPYTITGLDDEIEYEVQVGAMFGETKWSSTVSVTTGAAPGNVKAAPGDGAITISWTAPAGTTPDRYDLRYQPEGGSEQSESGVNSPYTLTGRTNGVAVELWVVAVYGTETENSARVRVVPNDGTPVDVRVLAGNDKLQLSWAPGAESHTVRYRERGTEDWTTVENVNSPHKIEGLTDGTAYELQVGAVTGTTTTWADAVRGTPNNGVAKNVTVEKGDAQLRVTWTPVLDALSYYIDWRAGGTGSWNQVDPATSPTNITGLSNDTEVCVAVYTRIEGRGNPLRDPAVCVTPDDDNRPDNLTVTPGDGKVTVSWSPVIDADSYKLRWKNNESGGGQWTPDAGLTATSPHTINLLDNGDEYCVHVKAVFDDGDDSPYNTAACATPGTVLDANMTVGELTSGGTITRGFHDDPSTGFGELEPKSFTYNDTTYTVSTLNEGNGNVRLDTTPDLPSGTSDLKIVFKDKTYTLGTDLTWNSTLELWVGDDKDLSLSENETVKVNFSNTSPAHATMVVRGGTGSTGTVYRGYDNQGASKYGSLEPDTFTYRGVTYTVWHLQLMTPSGGDTYFELSTSTGLPADTDDLKVFLKDETYTLGSDLSRTRSGTYWRGPPKGLSLSMNETVRVKFETVVDGNAGSLGTPDNLRVKPGDGAVGLSWEMPDDDKEEEDGQVGGGALGVGTLSSTAHSNADDNEEPSGPQSYEVGYTVEGEDWSEGGSQTVTDMSASISGLENGVTYAFRVRAQSDDETGPWSATVTATPSNGRPTGLTIETSTSTTAQTLDVSFAAPPDSSDHVATNSQYRLRGKVTGASWSDWTTLVDASVSGERVNGSTEANLVIGQLYEVEARWCGATPSDATCSDASEQAVGATPASAPFNALAVADPDSSTAMSLSWEISDVADGNNPHATYELGYSDDTAAEAPSTLVDAADVPSFGAVGAVIDGLAVETEYRLFVRSVIDHEGKRLYASPWASDTDTTNPLALPGQAGQLTLNAGDGQVTVSWTAPSDGADVDSYQLDIGIDSDWSQGPDTTSGLTELSTTVSSLTNGTTYDFRVRAVNAAGNGEWSETASAMPKLSATLIGTFDDITLSDGETFVLDMTSYFVGDGLTYEVMVTTTHQRTGVVRTGKLGTLARNKVSGSWSGTVLTLIGGHAVSQDLSIEIIATDQYGDDVSDSFKLTLDNG